MKIKFEKVTGAHLDTIFSWLREPHIMEFWDNTQAHKDDIVNFTEGRKTPSSYANGQYVYWIASLEDEAFAMLMTIQETHKEDIGQEKLKRLSKTGHTYGLDYMIGNPKFFGKGYGSQTLYDFIDYFREFFDHKADTFIIDPANDNPKAKHVYMKAGFKHVCDFMMEGDVSGAGKLHHLLIKKFEPKISIIQATMDDYPCIQNMARFYVYDLSRDCGSISSDWAIPEDGLYESFDFKNYFEEPSRKAYLVKVYDEIAGFVLLNQATEDSTNNWNMGEFFIIAKFQGAGIATRVAKQVWNMHPGRWEASVIPNNKSALKFWEKAISEFTYGAFNKKIKEVSYDEHCPRRIIFEFDTQNSIHQNTVTQFVVRTSQLSDIDAMVLLSKAKRKLYEKAQPQFWRYAGEEGDKAQEKWFKGLVEDKNYVVLTAESNTKEILGFIIGKLMQAPEVYNTGGLTLMIDDFCVKSENLWQSVGDKLIDAIKQQAYERGAAQIVVVCGAHDTPKRQFLSAQNLSIASEWYVGGRVKTLSTNRLILREVNLSHEQDYFEGFVDYEVIRYMNSSNVTWPYPKTGVRDFLESHVIPNQGKTLWQWGIFLKENPDKLIGSINLGIDSEPNRGFWLARKHWGHGYMTEAVEVINQFAFEELGFEKLIFQNAKGNERSRRIKEKTGGRLVKISPMNAVDPLLKESEVWELTKEEWEKHKHGKSI